MKRYHSVEDVRFSGEYMMITIDGKAKKVRIAEISSLLGRASEGERNAFEISPSGYGIHWPLLDEDISIDGLLGIVHGRESKRRTA